jgi:hypothetical protein
VTTTPPEPVPQEHVYLTCSNCDAALVDIVITDPEVAVETVCRATCPFCGDTSFEKTIKGLMGYDGFARESEDGNLVEYTRLRMIDIVDDVLCFDVQSAGPDVVPIKMR